jgi:hypothetical protein
VANAQVTGSWSTGATSTCTTGTDDRCTTTLGGLKRTASSVTFTVDGVSHATLGYKPTANTDLDGDSDGTSIIVSQ